MKKFGLKEIIVDMGMFDYRIFVVVGPHCGLEKYVQLRYDDKNFKTEDNARGKTIYRTGYVPIIWIPRKPKTAREHSTLAHEAHHAVRHLFNWAGIERNDETEEVAAHALGHIVNEILKRA